MHLKLRAQAKKQIEQIDAHIDKMYTLRGSIESAQYVFNRLFRSCSAQAFLFTG